MAEPVAKSPSAPPRAASNLPPDNAVVRDYRPAAILGKPQMEPLPPTTVASRGTPPPTNVTPVTIRPQPDLPTHDRAIPVVPRGQDGFGYVTTTPGRSLVQSYDLQSIVIRPNETFATLSAQVYGTDRYQHALAEFLRDRDPRLTQLVPGQTVDVPPAEELERRFARLIPSASDAEARVPVATASAPGWSAAPAAAASSTPPAQAEPSSALTRPTLPRPAPPAVAAGPRSEGRPSVAEKRYRVQVNDTLYGIAKRTLGSGERWTEIYELNKDLLQGGTQLQANMLLRMPADAKLDGSNPSP
jgi:nucleoid-associated protein YgaU